MRIWNPNESYRHVLRGMAHKYRYKSSQEIQLAICLSSFIFNSGFTWTIKEVCKFLSLDNSIQPYNNLVTVGKMDIRHADCRKINWQITLNKKEYSTFQEYLNDMKHGHHRNIHYKTSLKISMVLSIICSPSYVFL